VKADLRNQYLNNLERSEIDMCSLRSITASKWPTERSSGSLQGWLNVRERVMCRLPRTPKDSAAKTKDSLSAMPL
jgi:hypothetical protein